MRYWRVMLQEECIQCLINVQIGVLSRTRRFLFVAVGIIAERENLILKNLEPRPRPSTSHYRTKGGHIRSNECLALEIYCNKRMLLLKQRVHRNEQAFREKRILQGGQIAQEERARQRNKAAPGTRSLHHEPKMQLKQDFQSSVKYLQVQRGSLHLRLNHQYLPLRNLHLQNGYL